MDRTVARRLRKRDPHHENQSFRSQSPEIELLENRLSREIEAEVYLSIWQDHPRWKAAQKLFSEIKKIVIELIDNDPLFQSVETSNKNLWKQKIEEMRLRIPKSDTKISDRLSCAKYEVNAKYHVATNSVTLCVGALTSMNPVAMLAHEVSHALTVWSNLQFFLEKTRFGMLLNRQQKIFCEKKARTGCTLEWADFRKKIPDQVREFNDFKTQMNELNRCLQPKSPSDPALGDPLALAKSETRQVISDLARTNSFTYAVVPELMSLDGKSHFNPHQLNPCSENDLNPVNLNLFSGNTFFLIFLSEYSCLDQKLARSARMDQAIRQSSEIYETLLAEILKIEGDTVARDLKVNAGLSVSSEEQFSDFLSSLVIKKILEKHRDPEDRWSVFFSANAWRCDPPSLESQYPAEKQVENHYYLEPHSKGFRSRIEMLSAPIREVLGCEKDFELRECGN